MEIAIAAGIDHYILACFCFTLFLTIVLTTGLIFFYIRCFTKKYRKK